MENIYETLQNKFIEIRHLLGEDCFDEVRFANVKTDIEKIRIELKKESNKNNQLLIDCIDTLFQLAGENERQKIFDFADLIHNIPEIYLGKRNIKSFKTEIRFFNKKYKTKYFNEYTKFNPILFTL